MIDEDRALFELHNAVHDLTKSVERQNTLQEEANGIMRALIDALNASTDNITDLKNSLSTSCK